MKPLVRPRLVRSAARRGAAAVFVSRRRDTERSLRAALVAAGLAAAALPGAGCGTHEDPAARMSVQEATITAEVRSRLLMVNELKPLPISVDTHGRTVTVSGSVHESAEARTISSIASGVKGVQRVELQLSIVPAVDSTVAPKPPSPKRASAPSAPQAPLPSREEAG